MTANKISFSPYIVSPSSLVQSYASASTSSAVPSVTDLVTLDTELRSLQTDLDDRRAKLKADEERLRHWKGKAKERPPSASPAPLAAANGTTNGLHADHKALQRMRRESSISSSADLSETDSSIVRVKKGDGKKRKRKRNAIEDSDEDYSENEIALAAMQPIVHEAKARKTMPQPPSLPNSGSNPNLAVPSPVAKVKQKTSSPAPMPAATPSHPPAPSIKLKLSSLGSMKSVSATPPPSQIHAMPSHPSINIVSPSKKSQPGVAEDFSLPTRTLVPPKPHSKPPIPLPKHQRDVTENFANVKVGAQTPFTTFQTYLEPYLRNFTEEDLMWLTHKTEDLSPFLIPALGRHYTEWNLADDNAGSALDPPPLDHFRPEDITDERLPTESIYGGPLAERLVASLFQAPVVVEADDDKVPAVNGTAMPPPSGDVEMTSASPLSPLDEPPPGDAMDVEDRIRRELRFLGLFPPNPQGSPGNRARDGEVDWSARTDDEISAELKACQRLLSEQIFVNEAAKAKLAEGVKDRMARQEFESMRDSLEKTIETGYLKRQRHAAKAKSAAASASATTNTNDAAPATQAATAVKAQPLSSELVEALQRRKKLIDGLREIVFADARPGRFFGIPEE